MGLGSLRDVPLARARELAASARQQIAEGHDPLALRKATEARRVLTFGEAADALVESMGPSWRNEKHKAQWSMTLTVYAAPLRPKPVDAITTEDVLGVLKPIWSKKAETASRLRGRIERVLDYAKAHGHRSGENPARWRGHLDAVLPKRQKLTRGHHRAMPFDDVPAFMEQLANQPGIAARALAFTVLTATRTGEVIGATWDEVDLVSGVWTIPARRTKVAREHRVPLSTQAVAILTAQQEQRTSAYVFPGQRRDRPLSNMAMDAVLRRMKAEVTVHGFRSAFRDWVGETTDYPREVAEAALGHLVGSEVERAYRRGDALQKRRELMQAWADHCFR
jgi:integrase